MNKYAKKALFAGIGLATLVGTFSPHKDDFPPIYTNKTGNGYGISLSILSDSENDLKFYGVNASVFGIHRGETNGVSLAFLNFGDKYGKINGLEAGLINSEDNIVNGIQIGLINHQENGDVVQIGIYNSSTKKKDTRRSLLLNYDFR